MSYIAITFACAHYECDAAVTVQVPVDKDYDFEAAIRQAGVQIQKSCSWEIHGGDAFCAEHPQWRGG